MIGTQIGGYRVVEHLADGGMGSVFIARHEMMQREAVVKVLLPELSNNKEIVRRFLNEARAATQIHHPGIVEIFDMGHLPSGQAFIAMERLRGDSLATRLKQGRFSLEQTVALTRQLGSALGAAHEVAIVHRDLKPDNLFLARDPSVRDPIVPGGERLKILDFGIAKLAQGSGTFATVAGAVFGTPPYMSPEQCTSAGHVDHRSDIYAVGCILYECLCGKPPFGMGGIELIVAHARDLPPPPRTLEPRIPPAIEAWILRMLEKDPARRPQTCAEMVGEMERALSTPAAAMAPTIAAPMTAPRAAVPVPTPMAAGQQLPATIRRRRTPLLAGLAVTGVALAVVVALVGGKLLQSSSTPSVAPRSETALAPDAAPAPVAEPEPLGDDLTSEQTSAGLNQIDGDISACASRATLGGTARMSARVNPDGSVGQVVVEGAEPAVAACLQSALERARFARTRLGETVQLSLQLPGAAAEPDAGVPDAAPKRRAVAKEDTTPSKASCDEVTCAVDPGLACCKRKGGPPPPRSSDLPESLDRAMISSGLSAIKGKVDACGAKSSATGIVKVSVKVSPDGKVDSVTVKEAPDPALGNCVAGAVRSARFAKTQNGGSFAYPFRL